jgi:CMP-N,N'-diacetyllegionaminic acid synthase
MIKGLHVIAVVPARGGSKSVKKKNIRPLGGKPLIAWSIETARAVAEIDRVIVSTDDGEISNLARNLGAEVHRRPPELATDESLVVDTIRHLIGVLCMEAQAPQVMVLLEPTCPLRPLDQVRECLRRLAADDLDSVATFEAADQHPHRTWRIMDGTPSPFIAGVDAWQPRQKLPPAFRLSGAVYAFRADRLPAGTTALLYGKAGAVVTPLGQAAVSRFPAATLPMSSSIRLFFMSKDVTLRAAMQQLEVTEERILFVIDEDRRLFGSVTDGDIRRWILTNDSLEGRAEAICNKHPYAVSSAYRMEDVRRVMLERNIACIPVVDEGGRIVDLLFWGQVFKAPLVDIDTESDLIVAEALLARGAIHSPQQ